MSKVSTHDLLTIGSTIQAMSIDTVRAALFSLVAKHPHTAKKVILGYTTYEGEHTRSWDNQEMAITFTMTDAQLKEVKTAYDGGHSKIQAIKIFRKHTGYGLSDSKDCVEWLALQGKLN